ncbi:MAG: hypothetical protein LBD78_08305 [Spirochaetaceae bacterium]|jgi:hypothetical protein|nr:hypothetical protein [Spirochaetaceae bacterium]
MKKWLIQPVPVEEKENRKTPLIPAKRIAEDLHPAFQIRHLRFIFSDIRH